MTRLSTGLALLALCFVTMSLTGADEPGKKGKFGKGKFDPTAFFERLDTNKDGKLTKEEFLKMVDRIKQKVGEEKAAQFGKFMEERFKKLDTNNDGNVSKEEFLKGAQNRPGQGGFKGKFGKKKKPDNN